MVSRKNMAKITVKERTFKKERHVRWNWEISPCETSGDKGKTVRIHLIVVDDKDRDMIMDSLLEKLSKVSPLQQIRSRTGKVLDSDLRYLFQTYDTYTNPSLINLSNSGHLIKRDLRLKERQVGSIDNYVESEYGPMDNKTSS